MPELCIDCGDELTPDEAIRCHFCSEYGEQEDRLLLTERPQDWYKPNTVLVLCAWCDTVLQGGLYVEEPMVSHGLCKACEAKHFHPRRGEPTHL